MCLQKQSEIPPMYNVVMQLDKAAATELDELKAFLS